MPRETIALQIDDLSTFTKNLRNALIRVDTLPGHAAMLGLVSRAAGYDNYQHLKAARPGLEGAPSSKKMQRALRLFEDGQMIRWPKQHSVQGLCMWVFWAALPARQDLMEKEVNAVLKTHNRFGDHALLRRSLIDHKLAERTVDGKTYRRIEQAPPPDALALIAAVQRPS